MLNSNTIPLITVNEQEIVGFILNKFEKGAKCFDGNWWGGFIDPVADAPFGFDVNVVLEADSQGVYYAVAHPYLNEKRDVDIQRILLPKFQLGFSIVVDGDEHKGWSHTVFNAKHYSIANESGFFGEVEAHRAGANSARTLLSDYCPLLFDGIKIDSTKTYLLENI